jgi:hypothetical protein
MMFSGKIPVERQEQQKGNQFICNTFIFAAHRADVTRTEDSPDGGFGEGHIPFSFDPPAF